MLVEAFRDLERAGLKVAPYAVVGSIEEALAWAKGRYPVVAKAIIEGHKSDVGAVVLDNYTPKALEAAVESLRERFPNAPIMVQQQIKGGLEVYFGVKADPQFGPIALLGLGGIYVELLKELSYRPCPLSKEDVEEMMEETVLHRVMDSFRGKHFDKESMIKAVVKLSQLAVEWKVKEMDINPLIVLERGYAIVDVRIVKA